MQQYFKETDAVATELLASLEKYSESVTDPYRLKELYQYAVLQYQKFYTSYDLSRPEYFETVEEFLKQNLSSGDLEIMTTPTELTTLDRERLDMLDLISTQNVKNISEHQVKYGWIGASEDDHEWTVDFFKTQFDMLTVDQANEERKAKMAQRNATIKRQEEIARDQSEEVVYLCGVVRNMAHLRLESRLNWARADRLFNRMLLSLAARYAVLSDDIYYYGENDILRLIAGTHLDAATLTARKQAYAFRYDGRSYGEYAGESAVHDLERREGVIVVHEKVTTLTGSIAYKGVVRGRVRVINAHTKNQTEAGENMQEGEILVTGMTRPHLIHAIKKAGAIVTDEGGITCHAAIVARELKKPCIIGTKIATQVLRDGDLVEVDADNGVVRVLERAEL
jgi:pyruvate,water dikinase